MSVTSSQHSVFSNPKCALTSVDGSSHKRFASSVPCNAVPLGETEPSSLVGAAGNTGVGGLRAGEKSTPVEAEQLHSHELAQVA